MPTKKKPQKAGATLANARESVTKSNKLSSSTRHSQIEIEKAAELSSLTQSNDLDEFLATAQLAGTEFTAEKLNVSFVPTSKTVVDKTPEEKAELIQKQLSNKHLIRLPRRPSWTAETTPEELEKLENETFLAWRQTLAQIQTIDGLTVTPFERNLSLWRQLWRVVERSDVVVQIADARNPLLFRCEDLEVYVKEVGGHKKLNFLLLNKADLLTEPQRQSWADYFHRLNIPVAFWSAVAEDSATTATIAEEVEDAELTDEDETAEELSEEAESEPGAPADAKEISEEDDSQWSDVDSDEEISSKGDESKVDRTQRKPIDYWSPKLVSTKELLELFRQVALAEGVQQLEEGDTLTVGLVGYPNVGKSSTINKILGYKKVSVSATPGKTKHFQTIRVDHDLILCDCPGLVMPSFALDKAEMVVWGILPIDQLKDCIPSVARVCSLIPREQLQQTYAIMLPKPSEEDQLGVSCRPPTAHELLTVYGFTRGFMSSNGVPDWPRSARYVLKDFVKGKLLYCTPPPGEKRQEVFDQSESKKSSSGGAPVNTVILDTLTKRHLLDGNVAGNAIDRQFFKENNAGIHVKSAIRSAGEKGDKKHFKRKEKLRIVYADLQA